MHWAEHVELYTDAEGYVFPAPEGGALRRHFVRRVFNPACVRAGLAVPKLDDNGKRPG